MNVRITNDYNESEDNEDFKLVISKARKSYRFLTKHNLIELNDLINEGYIGLLTAKEKYDPERGVPFSLFASIYINGRIKNFLTNNRVVKIPSYIIIKDRITLEKIKDELRQKLGEEPTVNQITDALEISNEKLNEIENTPIHQVDIEKILSVIPDPYHPIDVGFPLEHCLYIMLNPEERMLIFKYILEGYSKSELARQYGISATAMGKKTNNALHMLKRCLERKGFEVTDI